jgi:hypothetical protein
MRHPKTFDGTCAKCGDPHLKLVGEMESLSTFTHPHPSEGVMLRNRYRCPKGHETFELGYRSHLKNALAALDKENE